MPTSGKNHGTFVAGSLACGKTYIINDIHIAQTSGKDKGTLVGDKRRLKAVSLEVTSKCS